MISFLHLHWRDKFVRLCCLAAIGCFAFASSAWTAIAAAPPLIVADDILTFSGGTVSPDNPDV
ncbi:MAG: hypothetical protein LBU57_00415, partial [Dysgonamonadaceae bacterium]|nr:hypothetical protein [Dysgonamonadaceae bacterium]